MTGHSCQLFLPSSLPPENIRGAAVALPTKDFPSKSEESRDLGWGGALSVQCLPDMPGLPSYTETGLGGACPVISAAGRWQEGHKFKVILDYLGSMRPAWNTLERQEREQERGERRWRGEGEESGLQTPDTGRPLTFSWELET